VHACKDGHERMQRSLKRKPLLMSQAVYAVDYDVITPLQAPPMHADTYWAHVNTFRKTL